MKETVTITLNITLEKPPAGVDFALPKGNGNDHVLEQIQRSKGNDLHFTCTAVIKENGDLSGPYVQGPKGTRFLYINIGTSAGQIGSPWTRRLKIPLSGMPYTPSSGKTTFQTKVPGTAKDGSPTCATVKPLSGWKTV